MAERGDLAGVGDVGAAALHEDAPALVVHAVGLVDLDRHHGVTGRVVEPTVAPHPHDHAVPVHHVVHGEDPDPTVGRHTDAADPVRRQPPDAFVEPEALHVVVGRRGCVIALRHRP